MIVPRDNCYYYTMIWLLLLFPWAVLGTDSPLLWGPYRPNLYFGLRPRLPQSLMTGLMWFGTNNYQSISRQSHSRVQLLLLNVYSFTETRHACDQGDALDSYTWTEYDARQGGIQVLKDSKNNVEITTQFLKVPGGDNGGNWAVRIKGKPMNPCKQLLHSSAVLCSP